MPKHVIRMWAPWGQGFLFGFSPACRAVSGTNKHSVSIYWINESHFGCYISFWVLLLNYKENSFHQAFISKSLVTSILPNTSVNS